MGASEFLLTVAFIAGTMGLAAAVEAVLPLFPRTAARRGRTTANLGLTAVVFLLNWAMTAAGAVIALPPSLQASGLMARLGMPLGARIVLGVVVLDFLYGYLAHRVMHLWPTLWRVHRVHHSDPFVDVTTTYRNHPIESLWRYLFVIVPAWGLGLPAEAVVLQRSLSVINAILEHANVRLWGPLDRVLSLVWVTPNMHKVHHSRARAETNSNYGNIFSIHDRLLRTFTPTERASSVIYGLDDADPARGGSLTGLLAMPFQAALAPVAERRGMMA